MLRRLLLILLLLRAIVAALDADVFDSIASAFNTITSIPGDVVRTIWGAIKGVGDFFGHLNQLVDSAWNWMVNGVEWLGDRTVWALGSVFTTMSWLVTRWVPMAAHWALGTAVAVAYGLAKQVEHFASSAVHALDRVLTGVIHDLSKWARAAVGFILRELGKAAGWISKATGYVFGILAHPDRLVQWFLAALIVPLIKWLIASSAPVIRWLLGEFVKFTPELAATIEDAISKLI